MASCLPLQNPLAHAPADPFAHIPTRTIWVDQKPATVVAPRGLSEGLRRSQQVRWLCNGKRVPGSRANIMTSSTTSGVRKVNCAGEQIS
eukprot:11110122-Alexandrium_andersonii.AAC.1